MHRCLLLLSCLIIFSDSEQIAQESFYITRYHVDVLQSEDGSFNVTENIDLVFTEQRRGIIRDIEANYVVEGKNVTIHINDIHVENWRYDVSTQRGTKSIRIGEQNKFLTGPQSYKITYQVRGAVMSYKDHHELYWNLIGGEWQTEIKEASFTFQYPSIWIGQITDIKATYGPRHAVTAVPDMSHESNIVSGMVPATLASGEGLTLSVAFPKALFKDQIVIQDAADTESNRPKDQVANWLLAIPIFLASLLLWLWKRLRVPSQMNLESAPQYYPPEGMSPALVGTYFDHHVNRRDLIALLPYWGELGALRIYQAEDPEDMRFEKLRSLPESAQSYERELFDAIFQHNNIVRLKDVNEKLYTTMARAAADIKSDILERELYDQKSYKLFHKGWMIAAFAISMLIGILLMIMFEAFLAGIGVFIVGIVCFGLHFITPLRSEKGERLHLQLTSFYGHLKEPNTDRMADLISKSPNYLFEVFPYVLAFGLDKTWINQQGSREIFYPDWYTPMPMNTAFPQQQPSTYDRFATDFNPQAIERAFYSSPAPSNTGGGSFRGGGSVGGGFGGGGGRSW